MSDALVAAQGVVPQAESSPTSSYISPSLPGMIRNLWKSDPSENSVRTALKLAGDLIQELIDLRAAQVQPSSAEGEAALIREAKAEAWGEAADLAEGVECIVLDPVMEKIGKNVGLSLAQEFRARAAEYRKAVES